MSNPAPPKRARQDSPSPPPPAPPPPTFSSFFNDPEADLLILTPTYSSSDDHPKPTLFAIRRLFLQAMSPIFDDALRMGHPQAEEGGGGGRETASFDGQAAPGKLEMMRLDEEGRTLESAVRLLHRDHCLDARESLLPSQGSFEVGPILSLVLFAQKYEMPQLTETIVDGTSAESVQLEPVNFLGLALIAKHARLAQRAFAALDNSFRAFKRNSEQHPEIEDQFLIEGLQTIIGGEQMETDAGRSFVPGTVFVGWSPPRLCDMDEVIISKIPFQTFLVFLKFEASITQGIGRTWSTQGAIGFRLQVLNVEP